MDSNHQSAANRVVSDIEALIRLDQVGSRCLRAGDDVSGCLEALLDAAIFLTGADKGTIQLVERETGALIIRAQRGFDAQLLEFFSQVDHAAATTCSAARCARERVVVEDVASSEVFAGRASLDVMLAEVARAVQSTPLISSGGDVIGMISTHFMRPTRLGERECRFMDMVARHAAYYVERHEMERLLNAKQRQLERITGQVGAIIIECSRDFRYVFVNQAAVDFLAKPIEHIIGRSIPRVIGDAAFQVIRPYIDRVLAGERVEYETEIPYADIGSRHMHVIYIPVRRIGRKMSSWGCWPMNFATR